LKVYKPNFHKSMMNRYGKREKGRDIIVEVQNALKDIKKLKRLREKKSILMKIKKNLVPNQAQGNL